jgi:hypothetical protein
VRRLDRMSDPDAATGTPAPFELRT